MMQLMRRYGFLFLMLMQISLHAQRDSVLLKEVIVYGLPDEKYLSGSAMVSLDSSLSNSYSSSHLGETISLQAPVYFRNYGNGMLSGISLRGTAPQHTAVLWNGINITSYTHGQADFSILPATAFDEIKIFSGGSSARYGSGAFGGAVLLKSSATANDVLKIKQEVGSFARSFTSVKGSASWGKFHSSTTVYHLQLKNNFPVALTGARQQHAAFLQQGIAQSMRYDLASNKMISLDYWYHHADRDIQPTIGKQDGGDDQQDINHRLSVSYEQNRNWGRLKTAGGFINDVIVYNGNKAVVKRWVGSVNHQYTIARKWHAQVSADINHIEAAIDEYGSHRQENRYDFSSAVQRQIGPHSFSFNLRQPYISYVHAPLLPYVGANVRLTERAKQKLFLTANASRNFRAPTLNDRYWQNAGRKDIEPEISHAAEGGLWFNAKFDMRVNAFYQLIEQWIQWMPDAMGIFRPENIKQVKARGVEASLKTTWNIGEIQMNFHLAYEFTRSTVSKTSELESFTIGKQLIYTPLHTGNLMIAGTRSGWSASLFSQFSGKRFTEASNSNAYALRPFLLTDFLMGKTMARGRNIFTLQFSVKNIFNLEYQLYSGRAMPGRNYNIQLQYQLTQTKR